MNINELNNTFYSIYFNTFKKISNIVYGDYITCLSNTKIHNTISEDVCAELYDIKYEN